MHKNGINMAWLWTQSCVYSIYFLRAARAIPDDVHCKSHMQIRVHNTERLRRVTSQLFLGDHCPLPHPSKCNTAQQWMMDVLIAREERGQPAEISEGNRAIVSLSQELIGACGSGPYISSESGSFSLSLASQGGGVCVCHPSRDVLLGITECRNPTN